jgi:hypothetical protein
MPILNISIIYRHAPSKRFEAIVDSGAPTCLFHGIIGKALGMKVESGEEGPLGGVVAKATSKVYYHPINLKFSDQLISIPRAGLSYDLSVGAILGRQGFFDNYIITFDPCNNPPGLILERFHRV